MNVSNDFKRFGVHTYSDMVTSKEYAPPSIINALFTITIFLWYTLLVPNLVETFGVYAYPMSSLAVTIYSGCYEIAKRIKSPYESAADHPYFFSREEMISDTRRNDEDDSKAHATPYTTFHNECIDWFQHAIPAYCTASTIHTNERAF